MAESRKKERKGRTSRKKSHGKKEASREKVKEQKREEKELVAGKIDRKRYERQIAFVVGWMIIAFIVFLVFFFIFKNAGKFTYEGIKFQKTVLGDSRIPVYLGEIFITRPDTTVQFSMYLRNDPRMLENISVDFSDIILRRYGYISIEPKVSGCYGSSYASFRLAEFLNALGMRVKGATTDPVLSEQSGIEWRDCTDANRDNLTVVVLQTFDGDVTTIKQDGNCYVINVSNCEIIPAAEKFILETAIELVGSRKQ